MNQFTQNKEQSTSGNGDLTTIALLENPAVKTVGGHQKSTRNLFFSKFAQRFLFLENCEAISCILEAWVGMLKSLPHPRSSKLLCLQSTWPHSIFCYGAMGLDLRRYLNK